ncbi:MAG: PD-(D/E)XK nuclease family protein, partial [Paludibacteraceae bacterium]|nr:PD-(D/E)XK nuclease family protein [Paludibacteraceae bacterium]
SELSFSGEQVELLWQHELLRTETPSNTFFPTVIRYSQMPHNELFENCSKQEISRRFPTLLCRFCQYADSVTNVEKYKQLWQEVIRRLTEMQSLYDTWFAPNETVDFAFAKFAVTKMTNEVTIAIKGDPDTGLQVMGLLETRMMDFKNVIMLSVNEGILPKGITYNSLLPFDFKYKFDGKEALPNYLYQDQVYAYHFFRLLQRAENVMLTYNSSSDTTMAEKSRFISQLEFEVRNQQLEDHIRIQNLKLDFDLSLPIRKELSIPKNDMLLEKLRNHSFSASSLQTYILCPLKFCLRHLMKVQPPTILSDRLEANELGTVIHAIFNAAFDEIIGCGDHTERYESVLQKYIDQCDDLICAEILKLKGRESMSVNDLNQGYWLINRRIIKGTVVSYLEQAKSELTDSPWRITANEMKIDIQDYKITPPEGKSDFYVKMTGSIDRVQKNADGEVLILDYKTGKVEASKLCLSVKKDTELTDEVVQPLINTIFTDSKYDKLFQLVTYLLMYDHFIKESASVVKAGILSTREVSKNSSEYLFKASILKDENLMMYKDDLQECMSSLFLRIFDKETPFYQTENEDNCKNCDFLHLCGRQTTVDSRR